MTNPRSMGPNMVEANVTGSLSGQCCAGLHSICVGRLVTTLEGGAFVQNRIAIGWVTALRMSR